MEPLPSILPRDVLREACRRSFFFFVKEFWDIIINEEPVWNWHIEYLCDELQEVGMRVKRREPCPFDYFIINIPPGTSKSTIITIMYPLWCWTIDSTQRFICGSHSATVSEDLGEKAKKIFVSDRYKYYFPEVEIYSDAKTRLQNGHNAERYCTSTGAGIVGVHAHQTIIDDPLNPLETASEPALQTANKWIGQTLSTRKVDKKVSATILVMQRLHALDPTGTLLANKRLKIKHICLPAELPAERAKDDNVSPKNLRARYVNGLLDPVRLDREVLDKFKELLGTTGYSNQFKQIESDQTDGVIKRGWFDIIDMDHSGFAKSFQLDTAYTTKKKNDPSGIVSYFTFNNIVYITDWQSVRLEFPQLCSFIKTVTMNNGYRDNKSFIRVEPKASGKSIVQQLQFESKLNIVESNNPTDDKTTRASESAPRLEARRVKLIRGPWNEAFLDEVCGFPNAPHDEALDCLVEIVRNELPYSILQNSMHEILNAFKL